jgi:hypothetical protein
LLGPYGSLGSDSKVRGQKERGPKNKSRYSKAMTKIIPRFISTIDEAQAAQNILARFVFHLTTSVLGLRQYVASHLDFSIDIILAFAKALELAPCLEASQVISQEKEISVV